MKKYTLHYRKADVHHLYHVPNGHLLRDSTKVLVESDMVFLNLDRGQYEREGWIVVHVSAGWE
jgi:hypothetical protein